MVLADGDHYQIQLLQAEAERRHARIHIVCDLIHVLEYLWRAARCLHTADDPAAEQRVAGWALALLAGRLEEVIADLSARTTTRGDALSVAARCLTSHQAFLRYNQALEQGWPIATGVVEGSARYLIGDRLDITGARWGLVGAEAILKLRALIANNDLDQYWIFHVDRENQRVRRSHHQDEYTLST